jgi:hypothetical protein
MQRLMTVREITKLNYEQEKKENELAEIVVSFLKDYDKKKLTKRHIDKLKEHLLLKYKKVCVYITDNYSSTYLVVKTSILKEYGYDVELNHLRIGNGEKCPIIDIEQIKHNNKWCLCASKERNEQRRKALFVLNGNKLNKIEDTINEIKELQRKLEKQTENLPEGLTYQKLTEKFPRMDERYYIEKSV